MGKRKNLIEFLGDALNDSDLKENAEKISLKNLISNGAPKRTSTPLTHLTIKNELGAILELSGGSKIKRKTVKTPMTKSSKVSNKPVKKTKKRS